MFKYDVIVVGAGHAGCEAAMATARLGAKTLLATLNLDNIALMPCNPAIGGPAKSCLVREIDALGGIMAIATDATYMHGVKLQTLYKQKLLFNGHIAKIMYIFSAHGHGKQFLFQSLTLAHRTGNVIYKLLVVLLITAHKSMSLLNYFYNSLIFYSARLDFSLKFTDKFIGFSVTVEKNIPSIVGIILYRSVYSKSVFLKDQCKKRSVPARFLNGFKAVNSNCSFTK